MQITPDKVECTAGALMSNLHPDRPAHVGSGRRRVDDVRSAIRARKAVRKGFALSPRTIAELNDFEHGNMGVPKGVINELIADQTGWDEVIASDPSDLVAIAAAYAPLNAGKRRLTSVAIAEARKTRIVPISLTEYRDT